MKNLILLIACLVSFTACAQTTPPDRSKVEEDIQRLNESIAPIVEKIQALMEEYQSAAGEKANDEAFLEEIESRYDVLQKELHSDYLSFIKNNPNSYVSLMIIQELLQQAEDPSEYSAMLKKLHPEIQNSEEGIALTNHIEALKITAIGSVAPNFTQNDPNDKPISLSDFKGKYLLIDFWASWCGPCRKENPNVVKAYHKYKNENFDILGVSLDNPGNKEAWLNAIAKDQLTWAQVSDLNGWKNAVAVQYSIFSIPQNLLLNPDGVIIAKNLKGKELSAKLAEIFN